MIYIYIYIHIYICMIYIYVYDICIYMYDIYIYVYDICIYMYNICMIYVWYIISMNYCASVSKNASWRDPSESDYKASFWWVSAVANLVIARLFQPAARVQAPTMKATPGGISIHLCRFDTCQHVPLQGMGTPPTSINSINPPLYCPLRYTGRINSAPAGHLQEIWCIWRIWQMLSCWFSMADCQSLQIFAVPWPWHLLFQWHSTMGPRLTASPKTKIKLNRSNTQATSPTSHLMWAQ